LRSYEAGIKSRFWGGKATVSATAFAYDYANLQLSGVAIINGAPRFVTSNAGEARVSGLEVEGQLAVTPRDRISYTLALLDAHYERYTPDGVTSWAGRKLDRSPRTTFSLGYERRFHVGHATVKAGLFSRYSSDYVIAVPSQLIEYQVKSQVQSDLTLGYLPLDARWSAHAYARNLEDRVRPVAIDSFRMAVPSAPRTYGARLEYRF
jgi:iron complex outermembrane receptor protein